MEENQIEDTPPYYLDVDYMLAHQSSRTPSISSELLNEYDPSLVFSPSNFLLTNNNSYPTAQSSSISAPRIDPPFTYQRQKSPILKRTLTTQNNPILHRPKTRRSISTENPVTPALFFSVASEEDIYSLSPMMQYLHRDSLNEFERIVGAMKQEDVRRGYVQMGNHPQRGIAFREFVVRGLGVGSEGEVEVRRFYHDGANFKVWLVNFVTGEEQEEGGLEN